jgi:hypothetical protein
MSRYYLYINAAGFVEKPEEYFFPQCLLSLGGYVKRDMGIFTSFIPTVGSLNTSLRLAFYLLS